MENCILPNTYLAHYGVLGMRWGVRKQRPTTGTSRRTSPAYGYRQMVQKYQARGYSKRNADLLAKRKMITRAALMIVGGVAVASIAATAYRKIGLNYCDKVIKAGTILQNIGASADDDFKDAAFYAAMNKHDKKLYGALYPVEKRFLMNNPAVFKNQLEVTKDIQRASNKKARKIVLDKMSQDPQFKKDVFEALKNTSYGRGKNLNDLYTNNPKALYDAVNRSLATPEFQNAGVHKKVYSALEEKGYNAILDINDTKYSGYKKLAQEPTIVFGKGVVKKLEGVRLEDCKLHSNEQKYIKDSVTKNLIKVGAIDGAGAVLLRRITEDKKTEAYLNGHKNTTLSKKEIRKNMAENERANYTRLARAFGRKIAGKKTEANKKKRANYARGTREDI